MNYVFLYDETNNFADVLADKEIRKRYKTKIQFNNHLILGFDEDGASENCYSYLLLKYGNLVISPASLIVDRSPIMYKDYYPKKKTND